MTNPRAERPGVEAGHRISAKPGVYKTTNGESTLNTFFAEIFEKNLPA
jgi:hypothetical protein